MEKFKLIPESWRDLQDCVAKLFNEAGYSAITPHSINTVRGSVEVDVYVKTPDEFVKCLICECKYWENNIPKEKIHAFRTVVFDSGTPLGLIITKTGFQSGAIEAAKYSNVLLLTWNEFVDLIFDKWLIQRLKLIKDKSAPFAVYIDPLDFPIEQLNEKDRSRYIIASQKYLGLSSSCWMMAIQDLLEWNSNLYGIKNFSAIDEYLDFLLAEIEKGIKEFEALCRDADINLPERKFDLNGYKYMYLK